MSVGPRRGHHRPRTDEIIRPVTWCATCFRDTFTSRKAAKRSAAARYPGDHMVATRCPVREGYWHFGPITREAIAGDNLGEQRSA